VILRVVRNRVKVFKMPAIVAKLRISSFYTAGYQTRGPHVAREVVLCGPRRFLEIFKYYFIHRCL